MTIMSGLLASAVAAGMTMAPQTGAIIPGYGAIVTMPDAQGHPDPALRYRTVFSVTKAASSPDKVNPSLEKVARFLNLLGADGIRPQAGDVVVIIHGPATPIVTNDKTYAAKTGVTANPNLDLIAKLQAAGVTIAVCSQALHGNGLASDELAPNIRIDVSALTTLATLQLRGWAMIPD